MPVTWVLSLTNYINKKAMQRSFFVCTILFLLCAFTAIAQEKKSVSGTVLDEKGSPLIGVSVQEKGTTHGTLTDAEGKFELQVAPAATLIISYIGYQRQEVPAAGSPFNIRLATDATGLNEVVVTAMGIKRETRALGYAMSTVSSKEIVQAGSPNFASALYGKAAGVKVVTAPGGAASGVSVQVRGVSSINLSTQPLYVVDGVPIRNFNDPTTNSFGTTNNRIDGNGVLDINPEDIESMSILKGASASALYGSEATNGVVVITTKKGSASRGLGVDVNYTYTLEQLANGLEYQNEYGPGYDIVTNVSNGITPRLDGWVENPDGSLRPNYRAYGMFGPKFDGREVTYWDGSTRQYLAQKDNYKDFYNTGFNSILNVALSNGSDKGNYRFSYTRMDYKSILPGSNLFKNNFNFNGTLKLNDRVSVDLVSSYNYNFTHNRPEQMSNVFASFDGFFSPFDDMSVFKNKYMTSNGYKYVRFDNNQYDQDEKILYSIRPYNLLDYLWNNLRNSYDESQHRFINSATLNVSLLDNLRFRGRVGVDYTSLDMTTEQYNERPAALGYSGKYGVGSRKNTSLYGDALLIYSPKLTNDLSLTATGGVTGRRQRYAYQNSESTNGLVNENWFSLSNSAGNINATSARAEQLDVAGFGILNLNYRDFLYVEGTGRYEGTSTLPPAVNNYFYPSVNAGFILSEVVKLPSFMDYAKLRASYSLVGNHPTLYQANVAYTQYQIAYNDGSLIYQQPRHNEFGNNDLKSERKREIEFGLEARFLENRLSVDLSYYNNKVTNQIMFASTSPSTGATSGLVNAGDLANYGFEGAISARPIQSKNVNWSTRFNFAMNKNKVLSFAAGISSYTENVEGGGYLIVRSEPGDALGNIYVHPRNMDDKGNYIVNDAGYYTNNTSEYKYVGNIMPKVVGGFSNTVSYKNFSMDLTLDYRFGGKLISIPTYYQIGAGKLESTLQYRDAASGGIAYDVIDGATGNFQANPNGAFHDGMILPGVTENGEVNTKVISAPGYYFNNFEWRGNGDYSAAVFDNSYIKFREIVLSYNMPKRIADKLHFQGLQFSLIGRNLFYIYKSVPHGLDPEVAVGSRWLSQGMDNGTVGPTRSLGASIRASF